LPPMDSQNEPIAMLAQIEFGMGVPDTTLELPVEAPPDSSLEATSPAH